jgi:hypothetical protein
VADGAGRIAESTMSRTDKTRPYWVKKQEYANRFPRTEDDWPRTYRAYKWWHPEFRCGCGLCGWDGNFETPRRKKQRAEAKRQIAEGLRAYEEE